MRPTFWVRGALLAAMVSLLVMCGRPRPPLPPAPPPPGSGPPAGLAYAASSVSYGTPGTDIDALVPNSTGGTITAYAITPALPLGLKLDTATGTITGRPTEIIAPRDFTVTATNADGSTSTTVRIEVFDAGLATTPHLLDDVNFRFIDSVSGTNVTTVKVGTTLRWRNNSASLHFSESTGSPKGWNDVTPLRNGQFQFLTFNRVGTFTYRCGIHTTTMLGTVNVTP